MLTAHLCGLSIEEFLVDAAVELVHVHGLNAGLDLVVAGLKFLDAVHPRRLLRPVRVQNGVAEPLEDGRRDDQLLENIGELAGQCLFPRVRLLAFSAVASTVVIDVLALLQFANQQATAMAAMHQTGVREIVRHFAGAIRGPHIEQLLDTVPSFAAHQSFVRTLICGAVPVEIAAVKSLSKNMVDLAAV